METLLNKKSSVSIPINVTPPSGASPDRAKSDIVLCCRIFYFAANEYLFYSHKTRKARFYRAFFFCSSKNKWADTLALRTIFN